MAGKSVTFWSDDWYVSSTADPAGSEVKFDARGDGLARYTIMNYRRLPNSPNGYDYKVKIWLEIVFSFFLLIESTHVTAITSKTKTETIKNDDGWNPARS